MATDKFDRGIDKINTSVDNAVATFSPLDASTSKFRKKSGSVISSAKGNIFEFPVFISSSVPMEYATATTALLDQVYASYLQMAISINPVIDASKARSGLQFASLKSDTNKYLEYTDTWYQHDACYAKYETSECIVEFSLLAYEDSDAAVILEQVNHQPLEEFNHFFMEGSGAGRPAKKTDKRDKKIQDLENALAGVEQTRDKLIDELNKKDKELDDLTRENEDLIDEKSRDKQVISDQQKVIQGERAEKSKIKDEANRNVGLANKDAAKWKGLKDAAEKKNAPLLKRARTAEAENKNLNKEVARLNKNVESVSAKRDSLQKQLDDLNSERQKIIDDRNAAKDERDKQMHEKELVKIDQEIKKNKQAIEKNDLDVEKLEKEIDKVDAEARDRLRNLRNKDAELANRARVEAPKFISEKDIDRLNTMKPLLMNVNLNVIADDGSLSPVSYIVGVKTYNRIIDANTIPDVAEYPLKEMNKVMRKAKWRAGELKFFSDIVFHIKEKKQTAVDSKDPKRKWYRRLYELAHMKGDAPTTSIVKGHTVIGSFIADKFGRPKAAHGVIPNVTMVISKSDVDMCKRQTGIDLLNGKTAAKFCNELFLMALVVIDYDEQRLALLLPDMHSDFDVHSLASVNRQLAKLDSAAEVTRDIFNMINR